MTLWWRAQHAKNQSNTGRWVAGASMIGRERKQGERQRARFLDMCEGGAARGRESARVGRKPLPRAQASSTSGAATSSPARITTSRMSAGIRSTPHGVLKVVRTFLVYTQRARGEAAPLLATTECRLGDLNRHFAQCKDVQGAHFLERKQPPRVIEGRQNIFGLYSTRMRAKQLSLLATTRMSCGTCESARLTITQAD